MEALPTKPCRDDGFDAHVALYQPHLTLRDGTPVLIRRLVAGDAALYPDFLSDVTAEDLRLRFFGPMREVSHELLAKLIHYDPACATAFVAVDERRQKMLGVVRPHDDATERPPNLPFSCVRGLRTTASVGC